MCFHTRTPSLAFLDIPPIKTNCPRCNVLYDVKTGLTALPELVACSVVFGQLETAKFLSEKPALQSAEQDLLNKCSQYVLHT